MKTKDSMTRLLSAFILFMAGIFTFSAQAQVTVGSDVSPQTTLDIIGDTANVHGDAFRLIDGNQGENKVLTSDADGVGTWKDTYYVPDGVARITTGLVELSPELQTDWSIRTQLGIRIGNICQLRVVVRYIGTTPINIPESDAASMTGNELFMNIIHPDFKALDTNYATGYLVRDMGDTNQYFPTTHAVTSSATILFRYIGGEQIMTNDIFYFSVIYIPENYDKKN